MQNCDFGFVVLNYSVESSLKLVSLNSEYSSNDTRQFQTNKYHPFSYNIVRSNWNDGRHYTTMLRAVQLHSCCPKDHYPDLSC